MSQIVKYAYTGTALPTGANAVTMFDTTANSQFPKAYFAMHGLNRFYLDLVNDHTGTLAEYKSEDRGTTWVEINSTSVAAAAANSSNPYDYLVEGFGDWKLVWTNGGTNQTTFSVSMWAQSQRNPAV